MTNTFEKHLRGALVEEGLSISADPTRSKGTVRRARARRTRTGFAALVALVAVVSGGLFGATALSDNRRDVRPARDDPAPSVSPWDGAITNEYPEIARGRYGGDAWVLEGERVRQSYGDMIEVTFELERESGRETDSLDLVPSDDLLIHKELILEDGSARAIFGAVTGDAYTVSAVMNDGSREQARIFTGYESETVFENQYFVLFLPPNVDGYLHATDYLGVDLDVEPIGSSPALVEGGPALSGLWRDETWGLTIVDGGPRTCAEVRIGEASPARRCWSERKGGGLLAGVVELGAGVKALVGWLPVDYADLRLTMGGRTLSLRSSLNPYGSLGFPYGLILDQEARGRVKARSESGRHVSIRF